MKKIFLLLILICTLVTASIFIKKLINNKMLIGLIAPMSSEGQTIKSKIKHQKKTNISGVIFTEGTLSGKHVIYVNSGIGKINSAVINTLLITHFHPTSVIVFGIAGSLDSSIKDGDIIIGSEAFSIEKIHESGPPSEDMSNLVTKEKTPIIFHANAQLLASAKETFLSNDSPKVFFGKIATTDDFPQDTYTLNKAINMHAKGIDMESESIYQVCWLFNTPCIAIRAISDTPGNSTETTNYHINPSTKKLAESNLSSKTLEFISTL